MAKLSNRKLVVDGIQALLGAAVHTILILRSPVLNRFFRSHSLRRIMVRKKHSAKKKQKSKQQHPLVVGPSYVQVLQHANFLDKHVTLVLCGESHEDAIDVTRKGGIMEPKEGWVERSASSWSIVACRVLVMNNKALPLEQGKDWGKHRVENDEECYSQVALLWVQDGQQERKKQKGSSYLLEFALNTEEIQDDEEETYGRWIMLDRSRDGSLAAQLFSDEISIGPGPNERLFEWADLDAVAHALNQRRLSAEEIKTDDIDNIIVHRQQKLKSGNNPIWTWDEWFSHIRTKACETQCMDFHLVLEAPIHPWEVQLHRPTSIGDPLPTAPEYIRCLPEDEESDEEDYGDPSSDGVGSYMDFIYRKFMRVVDARDNNVKSENWLHCVDFRDMGCESAVTTDDVKEQWMSLLHADEREPLAEQKQYRELEPSATAENYVKFVPSNQMNPELCSLQRLRAKGNLIVDNNDDDDSEHLRKNKQEFTFPSFEGFFGQSADCLYYSPHVRLSFSPFLAKCVGSLPKWETFCSELFFGGTVQSALTLLDFANRDATHVRSPLLQYRNPASNAVEYKLRQDGEHYITYPFFPSIFYVVSADCASPPAQRTWSSALFAKLHESSSECKDAALSIRAWTMENIAQQSKDPKRADDEACGGEWFEAYLRAFHRDIYDDIDRSNPSELLRANRVRSESSLDDRKKYDVGSIVIPGMKEGFEQIVQRFAMESKIPPSDLITPQIECMGKILIDIWMSNLVDFSTMLKVTNVVSEAKNKRVVLVCYLGSAHTRALADCFIHQLQFRRESFVGKVEWEEGQPRTLQLPSALWELGG